MGETLILDAEALSALAHASQRATAALRARAIMQAVFEAQAVIRVPAPVLAEVCRGGARDAAIDRVIASGVAVVELNRQMGQRAGALLTRHRLGSEHAVDAFVVATAAVLGGGIIVTHDPDDIRRLAAGEANISVFAI